MDVAESHWARLYRHALRVGPPLFVNDEIVAAYRRAINGGGSRWLLLGVTPALAAIGPAVTAVDRNAAVLRALWPGDTPNRSAICADWREMAFAPGAFDMCVGDGSLNALPSLADIALVLRKLAGFLETGGRIAIRTFLAPEVAETAETVFRNSLTGQIVSFAAFKWRLMMAMTSERSEPSIAVADALATFNDMVTDRSAFALDTGFAREDIDIIDTYEGSHETYCFPTASQLLATIPSSLRFNSFVDSGTYELAERCPIAIIDVR